MEPLPRATCDEQGKFQLSTYDTSDGAPAGEFDVTIVYYEPKRTSDGVVPGPNVLEERFSKVGESGLKATIVAGQSNDLGVFEVSR